MKIAAWNLNHRIHKKPIPETVAAIIRTLSPDVLVLTEYVDADDREAFKHALRDIGPYHVSVSEKRPKHNQVLVASRLDHIDGGLPSPTESHAETNFLPITIPALDLVIVGMRAPAYTATAAVKAYWEELIVILEAVSTRKIILVGDVNGDPDSPRSTGGRYMAALRKKGWQVSSPAEPWSYISGDGLRKSRVDHLLASPAVNVVSAAYKDEVDDIVAAGPKNRKPISDHAILCCEVSISPPVRAR